MTTDFVIGLGREAIEVTLLVSAPMLIAALVIGVLISLFQAMTQIQEFTLSFAPKIVAVFLVLILFSPWMLGVIMDFTSRLWGNIPNYIR
jgi:flagellar biosynthetic protein FliQ